MQVPQPKPIETDLDWFASAAEQGNAYAQFNLGMMYRNGDGAEHWPGGRGLTFSPYTEAQKYPPSSVAFSLLGLGVMAANAVLRRKARP